MLHNTYTLLALHVHLAETLRIITQRIQSQRDIFSAVVQPESEADRLAAAVDHNAPSLQPDHRGRRSLRAVLDKHLPQGGAVSYRSV